MFGAVEARLRLTVGERLDADSPWPEAAQHVRTSVLECVAALEQLHGTLSRALARLGQLEDEVQNKSAALADAHAELIGTQAEGQRARHMSLHDSLTSLPNRACFRERLDQVLSHSRPPARPVAMLYLDLDDFKHINDVHGHDTGDELLRIVAARLSRTVRSEDLVSRLGGDEFACLLIGVESRDHLSHLACKLFDAVSAPLQINAFRLTVRPSIGIAVCPSDGHTAEVLLKRADAAMYHAKRQKSGYAFFDAASAAA